MSYLNELNVSQKQAVEATEGPVMVIAGAGSGKTRVLTYRIAHLINKGVDPFNILALTFTNKAAQEMKERIGKIVGFSEARNIWMGTFHSVFARILRSEAEKIGYPRNFTIYDTQDAKNLIKTILKEQGLDEKVYKPNLVYGRISSAKNNLLSAAAYNNNTTIQSEDRQSAKPKIGLVYQIYESRCFKASAMDFDDLLFKTNILLRDFPEVLNDYQHRFKYILVDEYQDTNFSQYIIVKKLAAAFENVCVVGDDAQSIYAFRGASIQNILNFKTDYPEAKTYKLEQNYRSTKNIVNAANCIIDQNKDQIKKEVWTDNEVGTKIKVHRAATDNEEGKIVANLVFDTQLAKQAHPKDFAILYRTNAQSRAMEEALRRKNIPYKIYGGTSFYQRKEIKDLLSYFRLVINPNDEEALKRVINYPARGIGDTTLNKITITANNNEKSCWEIITHLNQINTGINGGAQSKIEEFVEMIKSFSSQLNSKNAYDLGNEIASTSGILKEFYTDKSPEGISRYENIQELLNGLKEFTEGENELEEDVTPRGLTEFLQDVALLTNADNEKKEDRDKVTLMTIHAAKGLEFPYVFVVGLEENLFPSQMSLTSRAELEEERRLFYVAVTRAEKEIHISYASSRYKWGSLIFCEPSRFIEDIKEEYLEYTFQKGNAQHQNSTTDVDDDWLASKNYVSKNNYTSKKSTLPSKKEVPPKVVQAVPKNLKKISATQLADSTESAESLNLSIGMMVNHVKFGNGIIENIESGKATINFQNIGNKQLLLKFAKLTIVK
ncbi:MAG: ATP-dependent DNA helicase [Flavobacteriales bacterium CG_4_10_14_0_2_um_filter_32_8]|nr:MAG: ATP-dependent DNA helicase [Flavobacteriales bacterium CG_4_10_14_0_2_um_filter_32_8]PJB14642.1 MAG: ATP-dependent DNA helicase [Flavobacteriales bacterium CG_4_9_14_3_um_filter_32_8]